MNRPILLTVLVLFTMTAAFAKAPIKFGKVEIEELKMKTYKNDTSAAAVVLCDYGYFSANQFQYSRIVRIKILKKEGYKYADYTFNTDEKSSIKGCTYNLVDGEIVKTKLDKKDIHKEKITGSLFRMKVAMPDIKVGSVFEIEYFEDNFPARWFFQYDFPVIYSELEIESPEYFDYRVSHHGDMPLDLNTHSHWIAKDVPAYKEEPYINSRNNYIRNIELELKEIAIPGVLYRKYANTWKDAVERLFNNSYFEEAMLSKGTVKDIIDELSESNLSQEEKAKYAFEYVKKIKWNNEKTIYSTNKELNTPFKEELGNSADINLGLVKLLLKLDLDAYPIAISTIDNGVVKPYTPTISQFNYVIAAVNINDKTIFMDATEKYCPVGLLPPRCLNWNGLIVKKTGWGITPIKTQKKNKKNIMYTLTLNEGNTLNGQINIVNYQYAALDFRKEYSSFNSDTEFLEDYISNKPGLKINNSKIENLKELEKPVISKFDVSIENQAESFDNEIFIYPMLFEKMKEHPFKSDERKNPISFSTLSEKNIIINITIPEGYTVVETPKTKSIMLPDNDATFSYNVSVLGEKININCRLQINTNIIPAEKYPYIKEFFNQILAKHNEPIILKTN